MKLISLDIYSATKNMIIRHVTFNDNGLSLIVDRESNLSGSTIGKTTFVRCIDLCLGSSTHKDIYRDKETGTNIEVEQKLIDWEMYAILKISTNGEDVVLKRSLFRTNDQYINDIKYENINEYRVALKKILFPDAPNELSLRQIITKFIRLGTNSDSIFKYQDGNGANSIYQIAYTYFFNMYKSSLVIEKKNRLVELEEIKNSLNRKYHIRSCGSFKNIINVKEKEYKTIEAKYNQFDYVEEYGNDSNNLELLESLDLATKSIYEIKHRVNVLNSRIEKEKTKQFECDMDSLNVLYNDVNDAFSCVKKSFDEFIAFHNSMCELRITRYIKEKEALISNLKDKEIELENIRKRFSKDFVDFKTNINSKSDSNFVQYYNSKIDYEEAKTDFLSYTDIIKNIDDLNDEIASIEENHQLCDYRGLLNDIFKNVSFEILGEQYTFKYNDNEKSMPISSDNIKGKIGAGNKKTLVAAVDFAFDQFFVEMKMPFPRFIIHDKMELAPVIELRKVFEYCRKHSLQYIVPIMRDKIGELDVSQDEIVLELSKTDKLFRF